MPSLRSDTRPKIVHPGRTPAQRWQAWIDKIYENTAKRPKPLRFTPTKRCKIEQQLTNDLVVLREDLTVWQNARQIGTVSELARAKNK